MVFVIIAGEIDLSVGSLLGLLGGVAAILDVNRHWPVAATIPAVLALGVLIRPSTAGGRPIGACRRSSSGWAGCSRFAGSCSA